MIVRTAYYTDKGTTRATNQDALIIRTADTDRGPLVMAAVCDGMGGRDCGEIASSTAVHMLSEWFENDLSRLLQDEYEFLTLRGSIEMVIRRISLMLENYSKSHGVKLGTTLTMLLIFDGQCVTANVGDSRIYAIGEDIRQLSKDHSVVQLDIDCGAISQEDARTDKRRSILYQCLGETSDLMPDIKEQNVSPLGPFLLCSDGFWHYLDWETEKDELCSCLAERGIVMEEKLSELAKRTIEQGETDNITVIVISLFD